MRAIPRLAQYRSMTDPRPASPSTSLATAPVGARLRVLAVDAPHADELVREGLLPGAVIEVASRTPLGGPVIVSLGRVRVAMSADVASAVHAEAEA